VSSSWKQQVGEGGAVMELRLLSSANSLLDREAESAVRQRLYSPVVLAWCGHAWPRFRAFTAWKRHRASGSDGWMSGADGQGSCRGTGHAEYGSCPCAGRAV